MSDKVQDNATDKTSDKAVDKAAGSANDPKGKPPRDKADTRTQEPKNLDQESSAPATPGTPPNTSDD